MSFAPVSAPHIASPHGNSFSPAQRDSSLLREVLQGDPQTWRFKDASISTVNFTKYVERFEIPLSDGEIRVERAYQTENNRLAPKNPHIAYSVEYRRHGQVESAPLSQSSYKAIAGRYESFCKDLQGSLDDQLAELAENPLKVSWTAGADLGTYVALGEGIEFTVKQAQWFSKNQDQYKVTALSTQHTGVSSFFRGALACEVFEAVRTSAQQSR
jgi:hypothetical protein